MRNIRCSYLSDLRVSCHEYLTFQDWEYLVVSHTLFFIHVLIIFVGGIHIDLNIDLEKNQEHELRECHSTYMSVI